MDSLASLEIFVTVAADECFLKLWDKSNILIREIHFSTPVHGICFATDYGNLFAAIGANINIIPVKNYLPPQYIQRLLDMTFEGAVTDPPLSVTTSSEGQQPEIINVSLYARRKEKMSRMQNSDGRFSKFGRKKRDGTSSRDGDVSKGGRSRSDRRSTGTKPPSEGSDRSLKTANSSTSNTGNSETSSRMSRVVSSVTQSSSQSSER